MTSSLLFGYVDRSGAPVIAATLRDARPFHGELAIARPFGSWDYGVLRLDGSWLVEPRIIAYSEWSEDIAAINLGGSFGDDGDVIGGGWGLIGDGRVLVEPTLEDVGGCGQGLIPFRMGGRWGYLNREGRMAIPPRFDDADDFGRDGVAVVTEDGHDGYLDVGGQWRLPARFDALAPSSDGRGRGRIGDRWHLIDLDGEVLSDGFDEILPVLGGMARVIRDDRIGYIDREGQRIGDAWFDEAGAYGDGLAPVRRGDQWFFLDNAGELHGPYRRALPPTEGLARMVTDDGGLGFFSAADQAIRISPQYQSALGFHDGLAAVQRDGLWTFVDARGSELHQPYWHRAGSFRDGLATVRFGTRAGCVDRTGQIAVPLDFDTIDGFSGGRAAVQKIRWRQVTAPPAEWHVTPPAGLGFAGFKGAGDRDELRVTACLSHDLDDDASLRAQQILDMWKHVADAHAGGDAIDDEWLADYALSIRFGHMPYPVELAAVLLEELRAADLPIQDVSLGRFRGGEATPDPDDPRGPAQFASFADYAQQAFTGTPPPASEDPAQPRAGRWSRRDDAIVFAERTFTLHLPDIRICHGATEAGVGAPDARSQQLGDALTAELARRFDRRQVWVLPRGEDPGLPRPLDVAPLRLDLGGTPYRGFCFGIDAATLLQDVGPAQFRYRDNELMEAVGAVVRSLGLRPVIMWQRSGDPPERYLLNLWE